MPYTEKVWRLLPTDTAATQRLAGVLNISTVVAQLLVNREITEPSAARRFLDTSLNGLHQPLQLPGVAAAAERIARAIVEQREYAFTATTTSMASLAPPFCCRS